MSHWTRGITEHDTSALDFKTFLDQALGRSLACPPAAAAASSLQSAFNTSSVGVNSTPPHRAPVIEPTSPSVPFFDAFSTSSFGFFNPKDPGGNLPLVNNTAVGPPQSQTKPSYHSQNHQQQQQQQEQQQQQQRQQQQQQQEQQQRQQQQQQQHQQQLSNSSNIFGCGPHSPTYFNSSSSNQSSASNNSSAMFPISTFCIEETNSSGNSGHGNSNGQSSYGMRSSSGYHSNNQSRNDERHRESRDTNSFQTAAEKDNTGIRETGIVEKLLHSYGFLQSCERNARLFFHYSQFEGKIEHLRLGDPVEFEMTYDRRTGKPIASAVTKIGPEVSVLQVLLGEDRLTGMVTTTTESTGEGRISYENRGECFFLPYSLDDIEGNVSLSSGDTVSFQIATNQRTGNLTARFIRLENPTHPIFYRGVLCSVYADLGTIERADVAKQITFSFSDTRINEELSVGDNVEFNIQTRNGKEIACNISKLPFGTVIFEDIGAEILKGQVLKPLDRSQSSPTAGGPGEAMQGRLRYRGPNRQELEIVFGEKDQKGCFTLRHGDWVEFQIATDRRDKQMKATNIQFDFASFRVSDERREQGIISKLHSDFTGFITCAERDQKMYFRFKELLDYNRQPKVGDDVEFAVIQDARSPCRQAAIRIKYLPAGSVQFELPISKGITGVVVREPSTPWVSQEALEGILPSLSVLGLPQNVTDRIIQGLSNSDILQQLTGAGTESSIPGEPGVIQYTLNNWQTETVIFHWKDCKVLRNIRVGTKVVFDIHQVRRNKEIVAANIRAYMEAEELQKPIGNSSSSTMPIGSGMPCLNSVVGAPPGLKMPALNSEGQISSSDTDTPLPNETSSDEGDSRADDVNDESSAMVDGDRLLNGTHSKSESPRMNGTDGMTNGTTTKTPRFVMKGYIAALKDGFGFIETMAQDGEIFFHSSSLVGDFNSLDVGQEVEYVVSNKGSVNGKHAADMVKPLQKGSIARAAVFPDILTGIVVRPVRGANPDQLEYTGMIEGTDGRAYPYGIISMLNKKEILAAGDTVEFQVDAEDKPVNIRAIRKKLRATVEAVKGQYGFLSHELEDGKKLFFHMSEVKDHSHLNPGDEVEFVILQNPRNGKSSACSVVKLGESQRPERLLNRLSKMSIDETAPRLIVVRQPHGPDGTRGFNQPRIARKPGFI